MGPAATTFFGGTAAAYTVAAVSHILFMYWPDYEKLARWSTRGAWFLHTLALVTVVIVTGRVPIYTLFEVGLATTWLLMTNYMIFEMSLDSQAAGAFLVPTICFLLVCTVALPKPAGDEPHLYDLPASLVFWHVAIAVLGYMFFVAASVAGGMYLLLDWQLRRKAFSPMYYRLPSLEVLDIWGHRFIAVGFPLFTLGLATGYLFAHTAWGGAGNSAPWWQTDPKVVWTLGTWLVYAGYLIMRRFYGWGGRRAAWWAIVGFAGVLVNYFVMGFFSVLHRFGI